MRSAREIRSSFSAHCTVPSSPAENSAVYLRFVGWLELRIEGSIVLQLLFKVVAHRPARMWRAGSTKEVIGEHRSRLCSFFSS